MADIRNEKPGDRWWAGKPAHPAREINIDTKALAAADRINKEFGLSLDRLQLGAIIRDTYRTNS